MAQGRKGAIAQACRPKILSPQKEVPGHDLPDDGNRSEVRGPDGYVAFPGTPRERGSWIKLCSYCTGSGACYPARKANSQHGKSRDAVLVYLAERTERSGLCTRSRANCSQGYV